MRKLQRESMKLVWSPDSASKAYICTVKSCENIKESGAAEFLSAMGAGWNAKLIVESWSQGSPVATSIGLAIAARQTGGRHVCVLPDERSRLEYLKSLKGAERTEVVVGEAEEVMATLEGIEFLVVDCKRRDFIRILRHANLSEKGAVLACKNAWQKSALGSGWHSLLDRGVRIVRTVFLPVGQGLDIAHVGCTGGGGGGGGDSRGDGDMVVGSHKVTASRWIKHFDQKSGEEHFFRG